MPPESPPTTVPSMSRKGVGSRLPAASTMRIAPSCSMIKVRPEPSPAWVMKTGRSMPEIKSSVVSWADAEDPAAAISRHPHIARFMFMLSLSSNHEREEAPLDLRGSKSLVSMGECPCDGIRRLGVEGCPRWGKHP